MRWIKRTLMTLAVLVLLALGGGFLLPSEYSVERSIVIAAPPERIHLFVGDLDQWPVWEPWREGDPSIVVQPGQTTTGVGASQSWTGDTGDGELTFTDSSAQSGIRYDMSFDGGAWSSAGAVRYQPEGDSTRVLWRMEGDAGANPVSRYFGQMLDTMVGPMFERGLEKLKAAAEG